MSGICFVENEWQTIGFGNSAFWKIMPCQAAMWHESFIWIWIKSMKYKSVEIWLCIQAHNSQKLLGEHRNQDSLFRLRDVSRALVQNFMELQEYPMFQLGLLCRSSRVLIRAMVWFVQPYFLISKSVITGYQMSKFIQMPYIYIYISCITIYPWMTHSWIFEVVSRKHAAPPGCLRELEISRIRAPRRQMFQ